MFKQSTNQIVKSLSQKCSNNKAFTNINRNNLLLSAQSNNKSFSNLLNKLQKSSEKDPLDPYLRIPVSERLEDLPQRKRFDENDEKSKQIGYKRVMKDAYFKNERPSFEDLYSDIIEIELPKKGKVTVPGHVRYLGDFLLNLNAKESFMLTYYMREQMGVDQDIPDPLSALLQSNQMSMLSALPHSETLQKLMMPGIVGVPPMGMQTNTPLGMEAGQMGGGAQAGGNAAMMQMMQSMMAGGMAQPGNAAAQEQPAEEKEEEKEKTHFSIKLEKFDAAKKVKLIKELRKIDKALSIKEAKEMVEGAPNVLKKDVPKEEAEKIKGILEENGGTIVLE